MIVVGGGFGGELSGGRGRGVVNPPLGRSGEEPVDMYLDGRLRLDEMVSAVISLDQINDGFAEMKAGNVARSVIAFD